MIISNPAIRSVLNAIWACGLIGIQRDSATSRNNRVGRGGSQLNQKRNWSAPKSPISPMTIR